MKNVREVTLKLLELMDEGILDPRAVADAALSYLSEDDVADMAWKNELFIQEDEDEDEWTPENADYCDVGSKHHY